MFNRERRWQKINNKVIIIGLLLLIVPQLYKIVYKKQKESEKVFVNKHIVNFINNKNNAAPFMVNDSISFDSINYKIVADKHEVNYYYTIKNKEDIEFNKIKMQAFSFLRIQNDSSLSGLIGTHKNLLLKFIYNNNIGKKTGIITIDSELYIRL